MHQSGQRIGFVSCVPVPCQRTTGACSEGFVLGLANQSTAAVGQRRSAAQMILQEVITGNADVGLPQLFIYASAVQVLDFADTTLPPLQCAF